MSKELCLKLFHAHCVQAGNKQTNKQKQLFVKPLTKQELEIQQKALSFQIGQEIKTRSQQTQQPRVCYSYETNQSKERVDLSNDYLLVLTSPSHPHNEEVQATMENWAAKEETPR